MRKTSMMNSTWDLSELIQKPIDKEMCNMLEKIQSKVVRFKKIRKQLDADISVKSFYGIIKKIEDILEEASRVYGYVSLDYSANTQSAIATSRLAMIQQQYASITNDILFFDLWWKQLDAKNTKRLLKSSGELKNYLIHMKLSAKYTQSEAEERIINILDTTGATALVKIYDKITGAFIYKITLDGKEKNFTREELTSLYRNKSMHVRKLAYQTFFKRFQKDKEVLADIYRNITLNWKNEGIDIRGHKSSISIRNIANDIDDDTISVMLQVCEDNAPIFWDFFKLKAKMLNMKKLRRFDIYSSIGDERSKKYNYSLSKKMVLDSLGEYSQNMKRSAKRVFDENHLDYTIRKGKRDGAFCSTVSPKITPYILLNHTGKIRDVFTLAHELGHAVHSMMAEKKSILTQQAPLPIAETASTFSELLLYHNMSEKMTQHAKRVILSEKMDDLYATIIRQAFFTLFEIDAHRAMNKGATSGDISDIYLKNLNQQFGKSVSISKEFDSEWVAIPHFFHTPFYCYAYSFGNLLALSLFQRYKKEGAEFAPTYEKILASGGSEKPEELFAKYDFDISKRVFWQEGFNHMKYQIKELSKL